MSPHSLDILVLLTIPLLAACRAQDGYFWHVTDFHYDFSYHDAQLSCHGKDLGENPGYYGDYWCDSPWSLVNNSVHAMAAILDSVDFILWTGDTVLHGSDEHLSYDINSDILDNVTDLLKHVFPRTPVYATFGNHDSYPKDQFQPHNSALYNATFDRWRSWIIDPTQKDEFHRGGYYTVKTRYGLRIVAMNTNLYFRSNKAVLNETDPAGQFAWLRRLLTEAEAANEKVLLTAHIAPGVHTPDGLIWMYKQYNDELNEIIATHSSVLSAMHFGHEHDDGFRLVYDNSGSPAVPLFFAPSVTPWRFIIPSIEGPAHNPGIRLVKYDRPSGRVQDIKQYYLDLPSANRDREAVWKLEYQATNDYSVPDLSAASLDGLIARMKDAGSAEFALYWRWMTVSPDDSLVETCDASCHAAIFCGFQHFNMADFHECKSAMMSSAAWLYERALVCSVLLAVLSLLGIQGLVI